MTATTETTVLNTIRIVSSPGVLEGAPRLEGHRIGVHHIALYHQYAGWPVQEIAEALGLSLAEVHTALAYYYQHQDEIDSAIKEEQEEIDRLKAEQETFAGGADHLQEIITAAAVASTYDLAPRTVYDAIEHGWIEALKSGGTWLIRRADAEKRWGDRKK